MVGPDHSNEDGFSTVTDPCPTNIDKIPYSFVLIGSAKNHKMTKPLLCLFDSGSTSSWIKKSSIPAGCNGTTTTVVTGQTMAGTFTSNQALTCNNVSFPEFFRARSFESVGARIFFSECRYDVIFGRDLISQMGLILDFKDGYMEWDGQNVVMRAFPDQPSTGPSGISDPPIASQMFSEMLEEGLSAHDDSFNGSGEAYPDDLPELCPRSPYTPYEEDYDDLPDLGPRTPYTPNTTETFQVSEYPSSWL